MSFIKLVSRHALSICHSSNTTANIDKKKKSGNKMKKNKTQNAHFLTCAFSEMPLGDRRTVSFIQPSSGHTEEEEEAEGLSDCHARGPVVFSSSIHK